MSKKSAAEIKEEAAEWGELITKARKRQLNFALVVGKAGGVVLAADPKKNANVMMRQAKANGGTAKGCQGVMTVKGKRIDFLVDGDPPPGSLLNQSKKHMKQLGMAFKVAFVLPSGEVIDDGEEDEDAASDPKPAVEDDVSTEKTKSKGDAESDVVDAVPETDPDAERKLALTAELKKLVPGVSALDPADPKTEKLKTALKAISAEISGGTLNKAEALLKSVGKALSGTGSVTDQVEDAMAGVVEAFQPVAADLARLQSEAAEPVARKARQIEASFAAMVSAANPKKAMGLIGLAKKFAEGELAKLGDPKGGFFDAASDLIGKAAGGLSEAASDVAEAVTEVAEVVSETADNVVDLAMLPAKQREALLALRTADPDTYQTAMDTLDEMEKDGRIDATPASIETSRTALEAANKAALTAQVALEKAKADVAGLAPVPGSAWATAQTALASAQADWESFNASLPEPSEMDEAQRNAAMLRGMELDRLRKEAEAALKAAADAAKKQADDALAAAKEASDTANGAQTAANNELKGKEGKKAMLDALSFGRLSPNAKPAFKAEDKQKFIEVFAKDGALARDALDLAARSKDPSVIAQNAGFVADKLNDGFAAPDGRKLDMSEDAMRAMAGNALQLGATEGQAYFDGFDAYLKSGKQLEPDPYGGLSKPETDRKKETARKNKIALGRSTAVGAAVIGDNGKVDFASPEGKEAMDHMMFHPGSLNTFSPHMTAKMTEMRDLFEGPKGADAQKLIDAAKVPHPPMAGVVAGSQIIAGTMGKKPGEIDDGDAKAAVMSAMMTPLSQGPVGSCFSTAPVRAIRETDPLRAMEEFQKIASTGQYETADNRIFPADTNPPLGENPMMRTWEYSVATAAAEKADSQERLKLNGALSGPNALGALSTVIPAEKWNDKVEPGKLPVPGIKKQLDRAISEKFKFEYNAGPEVGGPDGGGGDGHSSQGGYQVMYKGKAITSEAEMVAALKEVTLEVTGHDATSDEGKAVLDIFVAKDGAGDPIPGANSPVADALVTSYGGTVGDGEDRAKKKAPWNLTSGGMEYQTAAVLEGAPYTRADILGEKPATGVTRSARTSQIIQSVLGIPGTDDLEPVGTGGENAAHAFNALPNHPSNAKLQGPDMAAKIQSELVAPGQAVAAAKLPADRAARMFDDQIKAMAAKADDIERPLLIAALANEPTTEMTPQEVNDKIQAEVVAYRDVVAQKRADAYVADKEPTADNPRKAVILNFYKSQVKNQVDQDIGSYLMERLPMPEVVIADSNWGGPEGQTLFVAAPDPRTGDLILWKKDEFSGEMTPLGQNWEDGTWDSMAPTAPAPATP